MYQFLRATSTKAAVLAIAALAVPVSAIAAPSADEIIAKYIEATGGEKAYADIKTIARKGQFIIVDMGMAANLESYQDADHFRQSISIEGMGSITQGINDGQVWQMHFMEGDSVLEGSQADQTRRQADINPWDNWSDYFGGAEVDGEEDGDYKVVFKAKEEGEGDTVAYFDKETGLLDKMEASGPDGSPAIMHLSEYKETGGIKVAHMTKIESGMNIEMVLESVEINGEIPEGTFDVPETIQPLLGGGAAEGVTAEAVMSMMDADGDGKITMEEAPEQLQAAFTMVDLNADGGIDVEEAQLIADFMNNQ